MILWGLRIFYVALLKDDLISYPLAVKHQEIVCWEKRALSNRLTDKVILDGESIFLHKGLQRILCLSLDLIHLLNL